MSRRNVKEETPRIRDAYGLDRSLPRDSGKLTDIVSLEGEDWRLDRLKGEMFLESSAGVMMLVEVEGQ